MLKQRSFCQDGLGQRWEKMREKETRFTQGKLTEAVKRLQEGGGLEGASAELRQLLGVDPISGGENIYSI